MTSKHTKIDLGWVSDCRNEIYGFAILWIMVFHGYDWDHFNYSFNITILDPIKSIINNGNCGVEIFFILSGISLYYSFKKNQDVIGFYKKRCLRLFPALWIINVPYWLFLLFRDVFMNNASPFASVGRFASRLTQLSFWLGRERQAWYVAAIIVFYFTYPFIYHYLFDDSKKTCRRLFAIVSFTVAALLLASFAYPQMYKRFEIAIARFPVFFIGCGLGKLVYERKKLSWWWLALPLCLLGVAIFVNSYVELSWIKSHALWRYLLFCIGFPATFFAGIVLHYISWKPLHTFLKFFGNMSLEIYLSHSMIHHSALIILDKKTLSMVEYFTVIVLSIIVSFAVMKTENALISKKSKKTQLSVA